MDIIKYKLAENELKPTEIELANKALDRCNEDLLTLIVSIREALLEIKRNYLTDNYQYKFFA